MRKHFALPAMLAAILLTAGSEPAEPTPGVKAIVAAASPDEGHRQSEKRGGPVAMLTESALAPKPVLADGRTGPAPIGALAADDAALVAEVSALEMLAQGLDVELSSDEWTALAAVTLDIQAIRQTYEAGIAKGAVVAPGRFRVEIPMYASAGDAIRERFLTQLHEALGAAKAAEIVAKLGSRLEGHFGGFGVALQTLEIAADPHGAQNDYEVTRTVKYWNSVEGGDRLTTRRETHFPAWEDPHGERWGALLAVVGA